MMGASVRDVVASGLRRLRRSWWLNLGIVGLASSGVACAAAVFAIADVIVRNPLGIPDLGRVVRSSDGQLVSAAAARSLGLELQTADVVAARAYEFPVRVGNRTIRVAGLFVSDDFLSTLGVGLPVGAMSGRPASVAVSAAFWREHFGDDRLGGQTLVVGGWPMSIAAIAARGFAGTSVGSRDAIFVPLSWQPLVAPELHTESPDSRWLTLYARLAPNAGIAAADDELRRRQVAITQGLPRKGISWTPLGDAAVPAQVRTTVSRTLLLMSTVAVALFVLSFANVAALIAWRAGVRRREYAVAMSLGASVTRLVAEVLVEAAATALAIAAVGAACCAWLLALFRDGRLAQLLPVRVEPQITGKTVTVAVVLALVGLFASWLVPMRRACVGSLVGILNGSNSRVSASGPWMRRAWMIGQTAFATGALIATLTLLSSLQRQYTVPWGFVPEQMLVWQVPSAVAEDSLPTFYAEVLTGLRGSRVVQDVAVSATRPFGGLRIRRRVRTAGGFGEALSGMVNDGYFRAMRVPILAGREFERMGDAGYVVNRSFAMATWGRVDVVGEALAIADDGPRPPLERVIGVVADTIYDTPDERDLPVVYIPLSTDFRPSMFVQIRLRPDVPVASAVAELEPLLAERLPANIPIDLPLYTTVLRGWTQQAEAIAAVLATVGGLLLLLTAVGLTAVLAYAVVQRQREFAIRLALGAMPSRLALAVFAECGLIAVAGSAVGGLVGHWGVGLLDSVLFEGTRTSPGLHAAAFAGAIFACGAAGALPALNALRVQPGRVLAERPS